jgi:3-oxoacyl-[acyl-carrier protein] reductase
MAMYTVVKQAQLGLMRALASEYAATGVTINAVSPSMIETRFLDDIPGLAREMSAKAAPRDRNARTEDVVGSIMYLLSSDSDFVTGIELPVTGGSVF